MKSVYHDMKMLYHITMQSLLIMIYDTHHTYMVHLYCVYVLCLRSVFKLSSGKHADKLLNILTSVWPLLWIECIKD